MEKQAARIQTRPAESEADKEILRTQVEELDKVLGEKAQTLEEALRRRPEL
jgi:hypothetical protein